LVPVASVAVFAEVAADDGEPDSASSPPEQPKSAKAMRIPGTILVMRM
jgi:hypothetical protein